MTSSIVQTGEGSLGYVWPYLVLHQVLQRINVVLPFQMGFQDTLGWDVH